MKLKLALYIYVSISVACVSAQQLGDTAYVPNIEKPAFEIGTGPVVKIDEAHHNFHTIDGRYNAFAEVLRHDGYRVEPNTAPFNLDSLEDCDILVISNALNERNTEEWSLPTPSAFTDDEIENVRKWVENGGSLFLIADHMPFPGAAGKLAAVFGFELNNGFAFSTLKRGPAIFRRSDGSLRTHSITEGKTPAERIDSVATFTGEAFQANGRHEPILVFDSNYISLVPEEAWEFDKNVDTLQIAGWMQAATTKYGKGRVFISGEAAMYTSQIVPERPSIGLTSPEAAQNLQFLRNIMGWLSGRFD